MSNKLAIADFESGKRLDKTLASKYPQYSRSALEKLIETGQVLVNGNIVKTKYIIKVSDSITADFNELTKAVGEIDLPVLYEDDDVVVINKPVGVLAHSKGAFNKEGTVATWLKQHVVGQESQNPFWQSNRGGIVHRLDRATSGVMICAKNEAALSHLGKQFSTRNVKKTYNAVIVGELDEPAGTIDIPIERNPKKPATFRAGVNGKTAQTEFRVIQSNHTHSLLELQPRTGRTHQLRVHLHYLKHPIVGDDFYGGEESPRLMLHAAELEITLPGGKRRTFKASLPANFKTITA